MTRPMRPAVSASHPIANVFVVIAGAIIIGISLVLGFFVFLLLAALVLTTAAVVAIRVWWLQRKLGTADAPGASMSAGPKTDTVIEGEYRVVQKDDEA